MKTITNFKVHKELPPKSSSKDVIAWDTEFFGMDKNRLHRPDNGTFASIACTYDGKNVYIITDESDIKQFFKNIDAGTWVLQNAKFDLTQMRRYVKIPQRKNLFDTMLIEQIMYSGYYTDFSLDDMVRRYLGMYMSKDVRKQFESSTKMTKEQIDYAAKDVIATWHVYQAQKEVIDETCLKIWNDIDLPALWVALDIGGCRLDVEKWNTMAENNKKIADKIQKKYPKINLNSPAQVKMEFERLGYKNLKSTGKDFLRKQKGASTFAADMQEFRTYAKRSSTYGKSFVEKYIEADGRLWGDWRIIGAETGRFSCSKPNLSNIPKKNAIEFRECFVAGAGNVLVAADWSAQEPRVATYFSGDEKLLEIFKKKKDIYVAVAHEMGTEITKKDKRRSEIYKPVTLGASYGLSEFGLEEKYDIPIDEGKKHLDAFFDAFPTFAAWRDTRTSTREPYVTTIYGRRFWLNRYLNGWERNSLNAPIQGSGADAIKIAASKFVEKWHGKNHYGISVIRLLIHDEIVIEVPKKDGPRAMKMLKEIMIDVAEKMHKGIPADVSPYISQKWTEVE